MERIRVIIRTNASAKIKWGGGGLIVGYVCDGVVKAIVVSGNVIDAIPLLFLEVVTLELPPEVMPEVKISVQ